MFGQLLMFLKVLSGLCVLTSSALRVYHYNTKPTKTWSEAQRHCRENYTDLVTINSHEEYRKIVLVSSGHYTWTGLVRGDWHWSLADPGFYGPGETAGYRNWSTGEPSSVAGDDCVRVSGGLWSSTACTNTMPFICYVGMVDGKARYFLINSSETWLDSQLYCKDRYTNLASVRNQAENQEIETLTDGSAVWIGLFRNDWEWSDGSNSSFRYWRRGYPTADLTSNCVAIGNGMWNYPCTTQYAYVCYNDPPHVPTKTKQVLKLKLTPGDPTVDMNDPAVMEAVLKQMKEKLKQSGVSGDIKLTWKKQPDGKVFKKEEKKRKKKTEL